MTEADRHARLAGAHAAMSRGDHTNARQAFEQLVSEGDKQALLYLAWMDERGMGAPADVERAGARYAELAKAGDPLGAYYLASLKLRAGDAATALELFKVSAEAGNSSGAYWVSAIYGGEGHFPKNTELEERYLLRAAELGHVFAQRDIARRMIGRASNPFQKAVRNFLYQIAKLRGFALIALNANDFRVR